MIYINDIVNELRASGRMFADGTSLYIIVENPNTAAVILNHNLNFITTWAVDWLVDFNAAKTLPMILLLKRDKPHYPPIYMNGIPITKPSSHKHLGLTFADNCSWNEHINNTTCFLSNPVYILLIVCYCKLYYL